MKLPPSKELELPPMAGKPARRLLRKLGLEVDSPVLKARDDKDLTARTEI